MYVYLIDHSPLGFFRTNINKQWQIYKYSNKDNYAKNPNWQEADQLAIYKHSQEVELRLPRTSSASAQNGIWTRDLQISNPAL